MSTQTVTARPLHPVLNDYPAALVPASTVFDMLHLVTRHPSFKSASFLSLVLALCTGSAAAAVGYRDYQTIPEGTEEKRIANAHGLLGLGILATVALQVLMRITGRVGFTARLINVIATAGVVTLSWYGSHLVEPRLAGSTRR